MRKKICIVRLSAIGDVCHAVAMITRIRTQWPSAELTWVIGRVEYQLVKYIPNVRFIIFDKKEGKQAVAALKKAVEGEVFDALLMMQVALRANLASRVIKARQRIGFDWSRSKELHWLFANKRVAPRKHAHVLDGFMDFADALGVPEQPVTWDIPISEEDRAWGATKASELGDYAVIAPAASKAERNWLPERYGAVANHLNNKGIKVILCGGPGKLDRDTADAIRCHTNSIYHDFTGETSLHQLLALLSHAKLVVAPDTGPAHMAASAGTPVIGLYAHSNPRRTGPYNNLSTVVSVYDSCIQAQKGHAWEALPWGTRAKGENLMSGITQEAVITMVDGVLAK